MYCFNPRTRMGCDQSGDVFYFSKFVSIHAPAWGATEFAPNVHTIMMFQSTHPHGVRHLTIKEQMYAHWFQSTHPHGVRLGLLTKTFCNFSFNPRTRMGCDLAHKLLLDSQKVSIHAPAWGATLMSFKFVIKVRVSIHAPAWGATFRFVRYSPTPCFNPRTRMGCDIDIDIYHTTNYRFQSTHPHGVRHGFQPPFLAKQGFQSTHPHGVRQNSVLK